MKSSRAAVVDGWIWWATFHTGIIRHLGIVSSFSCAQAARAELHQVPLRAAAPQDRS